jgi:hypothetical protein
LTKTNGWHENLTEVAWCKKEVLDLIPVSEQDLITNQIQASILFISKTQHNLDFLSKWYEICIKDSYRFVDDTLSTSNDSKFVEHRHDQAIFSCLYKLDKRKFMQKQTWFAPDWTRDGRNFPIWTIRHRNG